MIPPGGTEGKVRPAVLIVVETDGDYGEVIAISTKLDQGDAKYFVDMPHADGGKCCSGFSEPCVAKCFWHDRVLLADCYYDGKYVPTKKLLEVIKVRNDFSASVKTSESEAAEVASNVSR